MANLDDSRYELWTVKQTAQATGLSEGTLRWWRHDGKEGPPSFRLGGHRVFYRRCDVEAWIDEQYRREQGVAR